MLMLTPIFGFSCVWCGTTKPQSRFRGGGEMRFAFFRIFRIFFAFFGQVP